MMDWRTSYHDLCQQIEILELHAEALTYQLKRARTLCFTGMLPSDPMPVHVPLDKALGRYDDVREKLQEIAETLEQMKHIRAQMEKRYSALEGLEYKVAYMRDVERKTLQQISNELGYSFNWISKVSSKIGKKKANTA